MCGCLCFPSTFFERERKSDTDRETGRHRERPMKLKRLKEGESAVEGDTYREKAQERGGVFLCALELSGSARTGCNFVPATISLHV